ncbi:ArsR/SmtB family transcription factor [Chachezhania antarctica]|uniref:ArsR/SmtB family transcription factor n=1 Tax=Chachezhania antarctica TaxID=2340860 RepID=UPI000EAC6BA1|nr:metalloregulator ArsR/SmtB family transcription factor [Chachezhania antarctica]
MVESESLTLDTVFHALGDATRRQMLRDLEGGARTVGELAAPHPISLAAASKHVRTLEKAGLLRREVQWRTHTCHLNAEALIEAHAWLDRYRTYWTGRLDVLEDLLRQDDENGDTSGKG